MLERAGHTVCTYKRSNWEANDYAGVKRIQLAARVVWSEESRSDFTDLLRREKPDIVHVHNTFMMISPSIFSACRKAGIPVVETLHNYRLYCPAGTFFRDGHICEECVNHGVWRGVARGCYRESRAATSVVALMLSVHHQQRTWVRDIDRFIALTEFARSKFLNAGLPADKVTVKPNFVDPDPGVERDRSARYALFVGRLSPEKRVQTLLAAWTKLRPRIPLVVIGGGPQLAQLQEETVKKGLKEITFLGHLRRDEAVRAMHEARFLVFSSEWYENFPVTIVESFACGLPVLCSRIGAMQEIVDHGRTGLHFTSGDPADMAATVQWAWDHPDEMRRMGDEARREFEARYTADRNYPILLDIYEKVMHQKLPVGQP